MTGLLLTMPACWAVYLHRIDPFVVRFTETWGIRWYGLAYVAGFACAYAVIAWMARRRLTYLPVERVADFVVVTALGVIVGGRLGYCLFYKPAMFLQFDSQFPYWAVLQLNHGGMASHGGMIGLILACLVYARRQGITPMHLFDLTVLGGTIGIFFGRIANFINGELLGRPMAVARAWGCKFPQEIFDWPRTAPQKLVELEPIAALVRKADWGGPATEGDLQRIVEATWRGDGLGDKVARMLEPMLTLRHPSQLYAALLEGALLFVVLVVLWRRPRKPGVVGAAFLIGYAIVRIFDEQFRMPDAHIGFQALGLTRGQWLSVATGLAGVGLAAWWSRRPVRRIGGWGPGRVTVEPVDRLGKAGRTDGRAARAGEEVR